MLPRTSYDLVPQSVACVRRGFSQEELPERAGLHRNYVGGVERGERNIALENIVKLAAALAVKSKDLLNDLP